MCVYVCMYVVCMYVCTVYLYLESFPSIYILRCTDRQT